MARLLRSLRCVAAALMLGSACATPATVRVAIPDLAGMLYPQQTQRVEQFGTATYATTPLYTGFGDDGKLPPCVGGNEALCLEVVWTSEFETDPFVLTAFESKFDVQSRTFDEVAPTAANVSPVVQGGTNGSVSGPRQTLWRFHTSMTPSIDLLFRLRQQSQQRAVRDQLLVHVTTSRVDDQSSSAAVEMYSIYGNAYAQNTVRRVPKNQIRLDVSIRRNASRADVVLTDAYPLVPMDVYNSSNHSEAYTWRITDRDCLQCTALMLGCGDAEDVNRGGECSFDQTMAPLPSCLRASFGLTTSAFKEMLDFNQEIPTRGPLTQCFANILVSETGKSADDSDRELLNATRALGCLAAKRCPFGPLEGVLSNSSQETRMIQLGPVSPFVFKLTWDEGELFSGYVEITYGASLVEGDNSAAAIVVRSDTINDASSESRIRAVIKDTLPPFDEISVKATKMYDDYDWRWSIRVEISNLVFPDLAMRFIITSEDQNVPLDPVFEAGGSTSLQVVALNSSQLSIYTRCDECALELEACQDDDVCRQVVLPCVIKTLETLNAANADVDPMFGTYRVGFFQAIQSTCLRGIPVSSWNPIRRALLCASRYRCTLDDKNTHSADEWTLVGFTNGTQLFAVPVEYVNGKSVVTLSISQPPGSAPFRFASSTDKLASFLKHFVLENAADVFVEVQPFAADPGMIQLRIMYANTMAATNPVFDGTQGLRVLENVAPRVFFEVGDATTFSLATLLRIMRTYLNARVDASMANYAWELAPECQSCNAELFGCSTDDVRRRTCTYDTASSPLGQCIREAIPRAALINLLGVAMDALYGEESLSVTNDLTRCVQTATSLAEDTTQARVAATSALSCYATTKCPFGPLDLVQNDQMVQLVASTYVQTLRVRAKNFQIQLVFAMGNQDFTSATIRNSEPNLEVLRSALVPLDIRVGQLDLNCDGGECTITIRYTNVVVSDFTVRVGSSSVPHSALIEQSVLRPSARLVVMPRMAYKVYIPVVNDDEAPATHHQGSGSNSSSDSGSGSSYMDSWSTPPPPDEDAVSGLLPFTRQCELCDSIHLAACERSSYCRNQLKPYFTWMLNTNANTDVAALLRTCTQGVFFDWWAPLQRWLVCYARNRCPISPPRPDRLGDSYLVFVPATINLTDVWAQGGYQPLIIEAPVGSSRQDQYVTATSRDELADRLNSMFQGITNVSMGYPWQFSGTIEIAINGPFLGALPSIRSPDGSAIGLSTAAASVFVRSTWANVEPMSSLAAKLAASPATNAPFYSCDECAEATLSKCRDNELLECIHNSLEDISAQIAESDYNLMKMLRFCKTGTSAADWLPVYQYLTCMSDNQCPVSENPTSYVSFTTGFYQFGDYMHEVISSGTIALPDGGFVDFRGTHEELRDEFQRALGANATVEMVVWKDSQFRFVDYLFHDYIEEPLLLNSGNMYRMSSPQLTLYATGIHRRNASVIASTIAKYVVPWNVSKAPCTQHLEDCVRSDSVDSLVCRHRFLPQVYTAITINNGMLPSGWLSSGGEGIELSYFLRSNLFTQASKKTATSYLATYLLCLAKIKSSISRPSLQAPRVQLRFTPGQQTLYASTPPTTVRVFPPQGASTSESLINWMDNPGQDIARYVLGAMDAEIQVSTTANPWDPAGADVKIVYGNYLGWFPTYDYDVMIMRWETPPSLAITSGDWYQKPWTRLIETLGNYSRAGATDGCGSCTLSLADVDQNLLVCVIRQLRALSFDSSFSIYDCVNSQPAGTVWLPLAQLFRCLVANGCDVKTGIGYSDYFAVYMGSRPGQVRLDIDFYDGVVRASSAQVVYPRLPGMTDDPQIVYATVDREDNYTAFIEAVKASLDTNGQVPVITITETVTNPYGDSLTRVSLNLTVANFFGFLPSVGGYPTTLSSFLFTNVNDMYNESPGQSLAALVKRMVLGTSPPVLKDPCSQYAADLFGCAASDVTSGSCSYNSAMSVFGSCLRNQLPHEWYSQSLVPAAMLFVESQLTNCFNLAINADNSAPAMTFQQDQWYTAANALAQFEQAKCPFGPLEIMLSELKTIHLQSAPRTLQATIPSASFQAIFRIRVGSRVVESNSFTDMSSNDELKALLLTILPTTCQPDVVVYNTGSSFVISIQLQYWYMSSSVYTLEIDAGTAGLVTASDSSQYTGLVVDDANTTFLSFGNTSSGSGTTPAPTTAPTTPTPTAPSLLLPFTKQCQLCDSIHLAACGRSMYCRTQAAPIVRTILNANSGSDVAAEIRASSIGETFFDRWEPIQRWLVCYARNRCPTSWPVEGRSGDSYLEFTPASLNLTNVWSQMANPPQLAVQAPIGSSLVGQTLYATSREGLEDILFAMTQNISNITRVTNLDGSGQDNLALGAYFGPFLGGLPVVTAVDSTDIGVQKAPASLYVKSTSSDATSINVLTNKLMELSWLAAPLTSCSECADVVLSKCQQRDVCKGYLLECLINSMQEYPTGFGNSEVDLSEIFSGCKSGLNSVDWLPVYEYFVCLRDNQCSVNDEHPVYLRIQPGGEQLVYTSLYSSNRTLVSVPGSAAIMSNGTLEELREELQSGYNSSAKIEVVVLETSSQQKRVDFWYHDYLGEATRLTPEYGYSITTPARVGLYAVNGMQRSASVLTAAFMRFMAPWNPRTSPCANHLEDCVRSDSVDSLVCRHLYLPRLQAAFTNEIWNFQSTYTAEGNQVLELVPNLRMQFFSLAAKKQAALFVSRYLLCVAKSRWPLKRPSSLTSNVMLKLSPGLQRVLLPSLYTTFYLSTPQGVDSNTYQQSIYIPNNNDPGQLIANAVLGIPDADILVTAIPSNTSSDVNVEISYRNYLGWLPSIDGGISSNQIDTSLVLTPADLSGRPWTRLVETLSEYARVGVADNCGSCNGFLDSVDESLALCVIRDLRNLAGTGYSIYYCVNSQPAGATWLPLAQYFQCLVTNGCDIKTGTSSSASDPYAVFVGSRPGRSQLTLDFWNGFVQPQNVNLMYPRQPGAMDSPQFASVLVNRDDNYSALIQAVSASLDKSGQTPIINITDNILTPYGSGMVRLELIVTFLNFSGFLPSLGTGSVSLSSFMFTNFNDLYTETPGRMLSFRIQTYLWGTSPPVLKEPCAQHAANLYGCTSSEIASGSCRYETATSVFGSCLGNNLPFEWYKLILPPMSQDFINEQLRTCFNSALSADESENYASFTLDNWYKATDAMAMMEQIGCPFGPLAIAYTELQMARLLSVPQIYQATIQASTFQAIFRFRIGFRTLETDPFTETSDGDALTTLVLAILPASTRPKVTAYATGSGFSISIEIQYWYLDSNLFTIDVDAGNDGLVTAYSSSSLLTRMHMYDVNTTFLAFIK